jgi:hypothetical protein
VVRPGALIAGRLARRAKDGACSGNRPIAKM